MAARRVGNARSRGSHRCHGVLVHLQGERLVRGGALPPALLFTAVGLALARAPRRVWGPVLVTLAGTSTVLTLVPVPPAWLEGVFLGCWVSVVATAATTYLTRGVGLLGALALALNAGVWSGMVVVLGGTRLDLLEALPCVLVFWPAAWIVGLRAPIIVRVVSSWLIAIAVLAATLQCLPVIPGYLPDHLE